MAIITIPAAGVSPYQNTDTTPAVLRASADGSTILANAAAATATVSELAATNANTLVVVTGQAALNSLITSGQPGVFDGANVTINLEEQNFNTTNQVTSTTNYPSGGVGEIQYNSGSNSFASSSYFTYTSGNVVTPGIRTDGYYYANGSPFSGGGNAAIGNFVFTGDTMSIAHANSTLSVTGNGNGNVNITANSNTWTFDNTGTLTVPGDIVSTNLIGTGSVSAAGNIFGNYIGANIDINAFGNVSANSALMDYLVSSANLQVSGTANVGALSTVGSVSANGNITTLSAMYSGNGATWQTAVSLANVLFVGADVGDAYVQAAMVNTGGNGSADWVSYANNGNTDQAWIDMGFTGNTFNDPAYTVTKPNDGYVFVQGNVSFGGNLVLATGNVGTTKDIVFATGGFETGNIKARLYNSTGEFSVVGNIKSGNVSATGNVTVSGWVDGINTYFTGAIAGNVLTVTGATDGTIARGQTIYGNTVASNTVITLQLTQSSGNAGGNGTYRVTNTQTVTAEQMYVNSLYLDGDLKLAADHGIFVRDVNDPYQYDNLIGIAEVDATVFIGSVNTNGVAIENAQEYKIDSALNPGTYQRVASMDATDNITLGSGNANSTAVLTGGLGSGYAIKFLNGGQGLMPIGLRIGDNINSSIFAAPLEVGSRLQGAANNQSSPGGIALPTYRGTGTLIPNDEYGSYVYGARYRGTINTPLPVKNDDWLMEFGATAFDGTNNNGGGEMAFRVDGTVTGTANPSRWELYVTPAGANNQTLGLKVDSTLATTAYGPVITPPVPLANLTAVAGARAFVNNGNLVATGNFGAQIGSGGSNVVPVWSDGANWYIG